MKIRQPLESWQYGDPSEFMDRQRKLSDLEIKKKEQHRRHKSRRIKALTKRAMEGRR